ncbi:MAG: glycosyltransferase family 4 protein [Candidatus Staskawiczbacteria bacterium]|jgi:glycosyltransferase involved in cell wall biosynthesis
MNQSDIKRKKIGWPEISLKRRGGVIHRAYVREVLSKDFDLELINLEAKYLKHFRYFKFIESFFYYLFLKGEKDLWVGDFYSTVFSNPKRIKGKNLVWIHHLDFSGHPLISQPFLNLLTKLFFFRNLKKSDAVVTICEYWRKYFSDLGYKNVYKIYGGFELDRYNITDQEVEDFKKENNLQGKPIIYLGNCQKCKGAVDSYKVLKDLDVYLITSGEKQANIPVKNLNLSYRDYLKLLKASSIVLTMSKFKEGWCRTAHEAMLVKAPVIGSGFGGMEEPLTGGKQIICSDFKNLKEKVRYLLDNPEIRKEMGENGFDYAKDFPIEKTQKNWLDLIHKILTE